MSPIPFIPITPRFKLTLLLGSVLLATAFSAASCDQEQMVYQRPVAILNQKAKQLMDGGQPQAAIGRLESALDLLPDEPSTKFNLAIAYQQNARYEDALKLFDDLLKHNNGDKNTLLKSMAVVYEAMADDAITKSQATPPEAPPPKLSPEDIKTLNNKAIENYKIAIQYYQQSIADVKTPDASLLQNQIDTLNQKIKQLSQG